MYLLNQAPHPDDLVASLLLAFGLIIVAIVALAGIVGMVVAAVQAYRNHRQKSLCEAIIMRESIDKGLIALEEYLRQRSPQAKGDT